jgi:hypothetical protein
MSERDDWLAASGPVRRRPWAYEEALLGSGEERAREREISSATDELERERAEVARLRRELVEHLAVVEVLQRRLRDLTGDTTGERPRPTLPRRTDEDSDAARSSRDWSRLLVRCEGFDVESPVGPIGIVEGVRFGSRIDRPDAVEIRGGRFGRRLAVVPVEDVADIRVDERQIVLDEVPPDLMDDLGDRVRRALHIDRPAPS